VILAIDSSMGTSVAVVSPEGHVLAHRESDNPRAHAELLGVLLAGALEQAGVTPGHITGVAMGIGPGAFTGLRVGMAGAQAFALSRNLPNYQLRHWSTRRWAMQPPCHASRASVLMPLCWLWSHSMHELRDSLCPSRGRCI
jgi:tRNA threonylcarbamoyl adenosine modification protein YeaZ